MDAWQKEVLFSVWLHRIMIGIDRAFQNKRVASFFVTCGLPSVLLLLMDGGNVYSGGAQLYYKAYSVWSDYASFWSSQANVILTEKFREYLCIPYIALWL